MAQNTPDLNSQQEYKTKTVVVVCSAYVRKHIAEVMSSMGAKVAAFGYLSDAMQYLESHSVDLIVLDPDCCDPNLSEVIRIVRCACTEAVIAFLVGWWDKRGSDLDKGQVHILSRPLKRTEIEELLKRVDSGQQAAGIC